MYGEETAGRRYVKKKITQREPEYDKNTDIGGNPPKSNGVDGMEDGSRTRVWDIPRTGIRSGGRLIEIVKQKADKRVRGYLR